MKNLLVVVVLGCLLALLAKGAAAEGQIGVDCIATGSGQLRSLNIASINGTTVDGYYEFDFLKVGFKYGSRAYNFSSTFAYNATDWEIYLGFKLIGGDTRVYLTAGYDNEKLTPPDDTSTQWTFTANLVGFDVITKFGDTKLSMENAAQYSLLGSSQSTQSTTYDNPTVFIYNLKIIYQITDSINVNLGFTDAFKALKYGTSYYAFANSTLTFGAAYTF